MMLGLPWQGPASDPNLNAPLPAKTLLTNRGVIGVIKSGLSDSYFAVYDGDGTLTGYLPYALVGGTAIGLDNNYKYAVYRDGRVTWAYDGVDPYYDPGNSPYDPVQESGGAVKTAIDLIDLGWDINAAPRNDHGVPMPPSYPASFAGLSWWPMPDYKITGSGFWDWLPALAFTVITMGFGSFAAAGAVADAAVASESVTTTAATESAVAISQGGDMVGQFDFLDAGDFSASDSLEFTPQTIDVSPSDISLDDPLSPNGFDTNPDMPTDYAPSDAAPDMTADEIIDEDQIVNDELRQEFPEANSADQINLRQVGQKIASQVFSQEKARGATRAQATTRARSAVQEAYRAQSRKLHRLAPGYVGNPEPSRAPLILGVLVSLYALTQF